MKLTWRGAEIGGRVNNASKVGIDQTMADCVAYTQQPPPPGPGAPHDTGWLKSQITFRPAIRQGGRLVGRWGNIDGPDYALVQEMKHSYLRRAGDALYPTLAARIRENM
jgi:hypothetical protein